MGARVRDGSRVTVTVAIPDTPNLTPVDGQAEHNRKPRRPRAPAMHDAARDEEPHPSGAEIR